MRRLVALPLLTVAAVVGSLLVSAPAWSRGYVSSPPRRQALCAQHRVSCGDIQYEPQSVEGPKGLKSCSGGVGRFAELDDPGKNWPATSVGFLVLFFWLFFVW